MHRVTPISTGWAPADDKRVPRAKVDLPVTVRRHDEAPIQGRATVLSERGALLELGRTFPVGATLHVEFHLPTDGTVECTAMVRDTDPARGVGVEFLNLLPGEHAAIDAYLEGLWQ